MNHKQKLDKNEIEKITKDKKHPLGYLFKNIEEKEKEKIEYVEIEENKYGIVMIVKNIEDKKESKKEEDKSVSHKSKVDNSNSNLNLDSNVVLENKSEMEKISMIG